jgi:integrase
MSWVERTPSGKWRGAYRNADGQRRSRSFPHKAAAERWAAAEEQKVVDGSRVDPSRGRMKWATWCETWWPSRKMESGTRRSQVSIRDNHVLPRWGPVSVNEIAHLDIQTWVNQLARTMSASQARQAYYQLSASIKAAVRAGVLPVSPCTGVRLPTLPPAPERYLTQDEVDAVFYHLDGVYRMLVETLIETGMRIGEAVALHEQRIDWSAGTIDVVEKWDQHDRVIAAYTKGKRRRTLPMTAHLAGLLREWTADRMPVTSCGFPHARGSRCHSALTMLGPRGAVIDPHNFANVKWSDAVHLSGVGHVRVHDLRHTYASRLVTNGVSIARLQLLLGHESITTTERYAHLMDTGHDEVRAALARSSHGTERGTNRLVDMETARERRATRNRPRPARRA